MPPATCSLFVRFFLVWINRKPVVAATCENQSFASAFAQLVYTKEKIKRPTKGEGDTGNKVSQLFGWWVG